MKRITAALLAALLLLAALPALAMDYTLDQKVYMQLRDGSGLKASLAFTMPPGTRMTALSQPTNTLLAALLPATRLDIRYIRGAGPLKGQEDIHLSLKRAEAELADAAFTTDGVLEAVRCSLLGPQTYASLKGDGLFLAMLTGQDAKWPGLQRALLAMSTADNAWRSQAEKHLKAPLDQLGTWLQAYTTSGSKQDDQGRTVTATVITVPEADLKNQLKNMLSALYQDEELLTLLRQQFSAWEAAAYLEPSMLPGFQAAIDQMPLQGQLTLERHFDQSGAVVMDELMLPMGGAYGLKQLHYRFAQAPDRTRSLLLDAFWLPTLPANQQGARRTLEVSGSQLPEQAEGMQTGSYQGSLTLIPEPGTFTVKDNQPASAPKLGFSLVFKADKEVLDEQSQQSTRDVSVNLKVSPQGFEGVGEQELKVEGQFQGAVRQSAATHFTGTALWQDLSTKGSITLNLKASTAAPWAIPTVAGVNALRLDSLTPEQLQAQRQQALKTLADSFSQLTAPFLPVQAP